MKEKFVLHGLRGKEQGLEKEKKGKRGKWQKNLANSWEKKRRDGKERAREVAKNWTNSQAPGGIGGGEKLGKPETRGAKRRGGEGNGTQRGGRKD